MVVSSKLFLVTFAVLIVSGLTRPPYVDVADSRFSDIPHRLVGNVRCKDGSKILPDAILKVWDYDFLRDDLLLTIPLVAGKQNEHRAWWDYRLSTNDGLEPNPYFEIVFGGSEVYYQFLNVCFDGQDVLDKPVVFSPDDELLHDVDYVL
uniref:Uncharacterized protein n=1 Tax=Panagrolaimus sp. PS1159 TaxID=55785 RepID=A0AC35GX10_9BILA